MQKQMKLRLDARGMIFHIDPSNDVLPPPAIALPRKEDLSDMSPRVRWHRSAEKWKTLEDCFGCLACFEKELYSCGIPACLCLWSSKGFDEGSWS